MKIQTVSTCFGASFTYKRFFFEIHQNLNFWWYFKILQANCLWANFGSFGQILLQWQWLRACLHFKGRKKVVAHEESVKILHVMAYWKAIWTFHPLKKFQKIHVQIGIIVVCLEFLNSTYGTQNFLGIKEVHIDFILFIQKLTCCDYKLNKQLRHITPFNWKGKNLSFRLPHERPTTKRHFL